MNDSSHPYSKHNPQMDNQLDMAIALNYNGNGQLLDGIEECAYFRVDFARGSNMRKIECLEIRIYEVLGVTHFRKLVFALERLIHKKDKGQNVNYHIPHQDIESFAAFNKYLFYNGAIHVRNILAILLYFLCKIVWYRHLHWFDLIVAVFLIKDIYCVLLQRYNYLRIKQRKESLIIKRNEKIAREVTKIDISAVEGYSYAQIEQDLQLVRRLRTGISNRHSVVLTFEDVEKLSRLSKLIESRKKIIQ